MATFNHERGIDYHLRALGFNNRESLKVLSMDSKRFVNDRIIVKPDWVIRCNDKKLLHIVDYKNRSSKEGPTKREMWQLLIYSWVVPEFLSWVDETNEIVPTVTGLLYGDNRRFNITYTDNDLLELQNSVVPAIKAFRKKGLLRENQRISATYLANYMVDPALSKLHTSSEGARKAGTKAHNTIVRPYSTSI